jgi:hypothetical protein
MLPAISALNAVQRMSQPAAAQGACLPATYNTSRSKER